MGTLSAIAVISAAAVAAQDDMLKVNTPTFVAQCKPVKITWQGGEAPYHLYVTAPGSIREVKADLGDQKGTSMTWKVSIPEGQKFTLNLCDKSGQCNQSAQAGPVSGGDDSCLNGDGDKGSKSGSSGGAAAGGGGNSKSDDNSGKSKSDDSNKSKSAVAARSRLTPSRRRRAAPRSRLDRLRLRRLAVTSRRRARAASPLAALRVPPVAMARTRRRTVMTRTRTRRTARTTRVAMMVLLPSAVCLPWSPVLLALPLPP